MGLSLVHPRVNEQPLKKGVPGENPSCRLQPLVC